MREEARGGIDGVTVALLPSTKLLNEFFKKNSVLVTTLEDLLAEIVEVDEEADVEE